MRELLRLSAGALVACATLIAQRQQPPQIRSAEVQPDGRIIFRLEAPKAAAVSVTGDFLPRPLAMQRDERGLWAATAGPLSPAIYGYAFLVDGVRVADPNSGRLQAGVRRVSSLVEVPGPAPMYYDPRP